MTRLKIVLGCAAAIAGLAAGTPSAALAAAATADGSEWLAASDSLLDAMRGGFLVPGVMVSFGITRTVHINGMLASSFSFQVGDLGSINATQAAQLAQQTSAVSVVQNGPGNTFAAVLPAGSPAVVIQNTLSNQKIQSVTQIDVVSNGMSLLKNLNLNQTLSDALGAAARR